MVGTINRYKLTNYPDDGVQGMIFNDTPQLVAVSLVSSDRGANGQQPPLSTYQTALLLPGDGMSYQLQTKYDYKGFGSAVPPGSINQFLSFWKPKGLYPSSDPTNDSGWATRAQLGLNDPWTQRPVTAFIPPGGNYISFDDPTFQLLPPVNVRSGIREGETNEEIWGSVHLSVKRENDGWQIPTSQDYLDRYPNPNNPSTSDWKIFTIRIKSL
jgi:hypothetical protein